MAFPYIAVVLLNPLPINWDLQGSFRIILETYNTIGASLNKALQVQLQKSKYPKVKVHRRPDM